MTYFAETDKKTEVFFLIVTEEGSSGMNVNKFNQTCFLAWLLLPPIFKGCKELSMIEDLS